MECTAGEKYDNEQRKCTDCEVGKVSEAGSGSCTLCPQGTKKGDKSKILVPSSRKYITNFPSFCLIQIAANKAYLCNPNFESANRVQD